MVYLRALLYLPFLIVTKILDWILAGIYMLYYYIFLVPAYYFWWKQDIKRVKVEMDHVYTEHIRIGDTENQAKRARIEYAYAHAKTFKGFLKDKAVRKHIKVQNILKYKAAKRASN